MYRSENEFRDDTEGNGIYDDLFYGTDLDDMIFGSEDSYESER